MADDYRDRVAEAIASCISGGAILLATSTPELLGEVGSPGTVTEHDLADAALAVPNPELEQLRAELERRADADAEALADQTLMKGLTVKDGAANLELIPPREIAAVWVHCAIGMLGDAPNYTETEVKMPSVSMEISPAGTYDRYALIVQRVGKLTPHEARQAAEARADAAEAAIARVRALHQPEQPPEGHQWVSGGRAPKCQGCSDGNPFTAPDWPCDTIRALDGEDTGRG